MEIYLVGGAVRDSLLGLPVHERDWLVVGATPEELLAMGYKPVGREFPVFLHPETRDEYALARTERKTGPGYTGFTVHADQDVTLEDDLKRRDLTINAMAEAEDGTLIDPYGGEEDLRNGLLRHISPAFVEDPVRILRVARFAARFGRWGFRVAHGTNRLMKQMVENGEVDHLVPERVWSELVKALSEPDPVRFFHVLQACSALSRLFPEIERLYGGTESAPGRHSTRCASDSVAETHKNSHCPVYPENHALHVLSIASERYEDPRVRFAPLLHNLCDEGESKLETDAAKCRTRVVEEICARLKAPNDYRELALLAAGHCESCHQALDTTPEILLDSLHSLDAYRRPDRFRRLLQVCHASHVSCHEDDDDYPQAGLLLAALDATAAIGVGDLVSLGKAGSEISQALRQRRIEAISKLRENPDFSNH